MAVVHNLSNQATVQTGLERQLRCEEISTPFAFASFEAEYRDLLTRSSRSTVYQSWEWLHSWWLAFGGRFSRLAIIAIRRDGRLAGCAPLVLERPGGMPARRLEAIGVHRSDYLDLVIEDGAERAVLQELVEWLLGSDAWDLLDLHQLPEDSPVLAYFRERQEELGCIITRQDVCPQINLPETWEEYLAGLGKKQRYNIGYYRRLLEKQFDVRIRRVGRDDLAESVEQLFRLHQLRWRRRYLPGVLYAPRVRAFHRMVASRLLDTHELDLYRMDLDGCPAALLYCFAQNGRGYYYLGGFDPDYSRYSVGTVLTAYSIQQSIARGHQVFDFLRGSEPYKTRWNVQERFNYRVEWLRGGPSSAALLALNDAKRIVERQAKAIARRLER
jgi:CelD/BcsL family acetyltransferase involved in cellulose biosynthesis